MSISAFVRHVQRILLVTTIANIVVVGASVLLIALAAAALLGLTRGATLLIGFVASLLLLTYAAWRFRTLRSPVHVALWVEELVPALNYAVVTSVDHDGSFPDLEKSVQLNAINPFIRSRVSGVFLRSLILLFVASAIYVVSPATSMGRGRIREGLWRTLPGVVSPMDKIATLHIRIFPPAYSGLGEREVTDASAVNVLAGSRFVLSGNGSRDGVSVTIDGLPVNVTGDDDSWSVASIAQKPVTLVRAEFNERSRLVAVEARADNAPRVALTAPLRDTTLRTSSFNVSLHAETADDIGLTDGYFEYLVVSGSGEAFNGRTVTSVPVRFTSRAGRMQASLSFANLKIAAGDLVSIRAVVRDNNSLTGPSVGTSDTRTFRVARADEYDSVSIEAAAPPLVDSSAMSQRMLIIMTEALVKKQRSLTRQQLVKHSDDIGFTEDIIRKRVYDILYQTESAEGVGDTEEAEAELQAINSPDLKQAYDALWDAVRSLRIAEPAAALPPMRVALKALDRARLAQRLYLRGAAPTVVVDIGRIRLTGKEKGSSSTRAANATADSLRRTLIAGFQAAVEKRKTDPQLAMEELSILRVRALQSYPDFADALRDAIDLLQRNRRADAALSRARNALGASRPSDAGTLDWGGG